MPSKKERKAQRLQAAMRAALQREAARLDASPLAPAELRRLLDFLAVEIDANGHDGTTRLTERWCADHGHDATAVLAFFADERMTEDFEILYRADPYVLFGPGETRLARMPLSPAQLDELLDHIDAEVRATGCAHDNRIARTWLVDNELPVAPTLMALSAHGGRCDCEIVMNIYHDEFYLPGQYGG